MPIVVLALVLLVSQGALGDTTRHTEVTYDERSAMDRQVYSERYGLDAEELNRVVYLQSLDRPFGDQLSPIELLGKYAETNEDRERYAQLYTTIYVDQMRRSQAWALAIQQVAQERDLTQEVLQSTPQITAGLDRLRIHPPLTDATHALYQQQRSKSDNSKTLLVSLACDATCGELASQLSRQVLAGFTEKLDIVFVGSDRQDEVAIMDWAARHQLNAALLQRGAVALHVDSDHWRALRDSDVVPRVLEP
ncbi:hypothetical protein AB833_21465 [Chromatiales bacterium (ex Bugula neritina AB1)]|nr:hypothetical protein AB833_21465 [Chromatiales bacterium (ex Bugula neritina AB1)]